jgi:hypothetical protein
LALLYQKSLGKLLLELTKRGRKHFASGERKERERSERKIDEIEEVFEFQKAKFSCFPENPAFGGFSGFSVPIWGTGEIDSKRGTIPPDWGRMASLTLGN